MTIEEQRVELSVPARVEPCTGGGCRERIISKIVSQVEAVRIGPRGVVSCLQHVEDAGMIFDFTEFFQVLPIVDGRDRRNFFRIDCIMIECHICIVEFFFSYRRTHLLLLNTPAPSAP